VSNIDDLIATRRLTHGDFTESSTITQAIKGVIKQTPNWERLTDWQKESAEMQAQKWGRILAGDPMLAEHWEDLEGYNRMVSQRLHMQRAGAEGTKTIARLLRPKLPEIGE